MLSMLCDTACQCAWVGTDNQITRGVRCEFLPLYSPDYNPIELAFSSMKYHLRRYEEYVRLAMTTMTDTEVYYCLLKALYFIGMEDIRGWYKYCGYV
jgi:transposase